MARPSALVVLLLTVTMGVVGMTGLAGCANGPPAVWRSPLAGSGISPSAEPSSSVSPSGSASPSPTPGSGSARPPAKGPKVAFFGDSQGMTLLLNRPADLSRSINAMDATIEGCGVLVGRIVDNISHEARNMGGCGYWRSAWASDVKRLKPAIAVIMIGAWDVFDLTLSNGTTLAFATSGWDANFVTRIRTGIDTLRNAGAEVAISLLPCYSALRKDSAGRGAGWWPQRKDRTRTGHVNDLLTQTAATYADRVHLIEPPASFCTNPAIGESRYYRWDGIHYSRPGAKLYFNAVLPQLLAL